MTVTTFILLSTCSISYFAFQNHQLRERLIFNPYIIHERRQWYRFITSGFIHADWMHLLVNMIVLYSFGRLVEENFIEIFEDKGTINFILLYTGGLALSIVPTFNKNKSNPGYNALGASGAVSAVVFSSILFNPLGRMCLYGVLCLPGIIFGVGFLVYSYFAERKGGGNTNHDAHLWGALFGFFFTLALKPQLGVYFLNQLPFVHNAF